MIGRVPWVALLRSHRVRAVTLILLLLLSVLALAHPGAAHRRIIDLGRLGGGSSGAHGINDRGQVVGYSNTAPDIDVIHAFLWSAREGMVDLGTCGGAGAMATTSTNRGRSVGGTSPPPGRPKPSA